MTKLPADVREAFRKPATFQSHDRIADIPEPVRAVFAKEQGVKTFAMAEPGARWQSTDVIMEKGLPARRLRRVALSDTFCVLFYEQGGFAHINKVAVFRLSKDGAKLVWHAFVHSRADDIPGLMAAIDEGQADDNPQYGL